MAFGFLRCTTMTGSTGIANVALPLAQSGTWRLGSCMAPVLVALTLASCQGSQQSVSQDRVVRFFDDLVFGVDYGFERPHVKAIRKWNEPIRVSISPVDKYRAVTAAQLNRFADITATDVRIVDGHEDPANLEISFVETKDFMVNREYVPCYAASKDDDGVIESVRIVVSTEKADLIKTCVVHELMHAFGFHNHSGIISSALSPVHGQEEMTPWDEIALRTLYDERLRPGMLREEAMPVVQGVIREMMARPAVVRLGAK